MQTEEKFDIIFNKSGFITAFICSDRNVPSAPLHPEISISKDYLTAQETDEETFWIDYPNAKMHLFTKLIMHCFTFSIHKNV